MVDVKVHVDVKGIEQKVSSEALAKGKLAIANQMLLDMERFVPKRRGDLRTSGHVRKDSVVYNVPYARIIYYGRKRKGFFSEKQRRFFFANKDKLLNQPKTPGTGPRWDKKAIPLYSEKWAEVGLRAMGVSK
ncbi:minor capsid protein [Streptococcus marmotae]|uniref:minor capsid protein n=1 Tax=Streptococcus marmotae TaxID=1825069 RepID=UPI00082F3795|nr:minor capsid protein [Streptococcus phage Javan291]